MANICENFLGVSGPPEKVAGFQEKAKGPDAALDFDSFRPTPREYWEDGADSPEERARLSGLHGYPDWYEWRLAHWGVKWNAGDVEAQELPGRSEFASTEYWFSTAWNSISEGFLTDISGQHPDLTFRLDYREPLLGIHGGYEARAGDTRRTG